LLGIIAEDSGRLETAENYYRQALAVRRELNQPHYAVEDTAGLAQVTRALGQEQPAQAFLAETVDYLQANPALEGTRNPFRVYLICYEMLDSAGDPRAAAVLEQGHTLLQKQADTIQDPEKRKMFLEVPPLHKRLVALWH
jgi:hypothetical protein